MLKKTSLLLWNSNSTGGRPAFYLATLPINHVFQQPQFGIDTSSPHIDSGPVTCFGQWDVDKCNTVQDLKSACSMRLILIGMLLPPCEEAWFSLFEDERNHGERSPARPAGLAPVDPPAECSRMRDPVPPRMTNYRIVRNNKSSLFRGGLLCSNKSWIQRILWFTS